MKFATLLCCFYFALSSCSAQEPTQILRFGEGKHIVLLLDSAAASQAITYDKRDRFFDLVTASEMSIQMHRPITESQTRSMLLPEYLRYLKGDMASFSAAEAKFTAEVMEKVYKTCAGVSAGIFPDTLKIIKTKGNHYGDGTYYTRENCIIIPANELEARKTNPFTTTMFHELFHVYSRLNPVKSARLYKLIGFETVGLNKMRIPNELAARILYNPDGVDFAQKITLTLDDKSQITAIPIIYANNLGAKPGQNEFFGYLEFNLYRIVAEDDGTWRVITKADGISSTLSLDKLPDFFRQIKDNTGYIIHPDEVLADNFSFIMVEKNGTKLSAKFSPEGKKLLVDIEAILSEK